MPTLKHYPTTEYVRSMIKPDQMDTLVSEVSSYRQTKEIASYAGDVTTDIMHSWASFAADVQEQNEGIEFNGPFTLVHRLTRDELEEIVVSDQQQKRYYHPEDYTDEYDEDDYKS